MKKTILLTLLLFFSGAFWLSQASGDYHTPEGNVYKGRVVEDGAFEFQIDQSDLGSHVVSSVDSFWVRATIKSGLFTAREREFTLNPHAIRGVQVLGADVYNERGERLGSLNSFNKVLADSRVNDTYHFKVYYQVLQQGQYAVEVAGDDLNYTGSGAENWLARLFNTIVASAEETTSATGTGTPLIAELNYTADDYTGTYNSGDGSFTYTIPWGVNTSRAGVVFTGKGGPWQNNDTIASGLGDTGFNSAPTVFNMGGTWYLISGDSGGGFYGFNWTGSGWQTDNGVVSGLGDTGSYSTPTVFNMGGTWYLITGDYDGVFLGFNWTGSGWQTDNGVVSGLGDIGTNSVPTVFNMSGTWYLIGGEANAGYHGFNWTGSGWQTDNGVVSGLGDTGSNSAPTVFNIGGGTWYLITGDYDGVFLGFNWTGSGWQTDNGVVSGLVSDIGTKSVPTVFNMSGTWYLISGELLGGFYGFKFAPATNPSFTVSGNAITHSGVLLYGEQSPEYSLLGVLTPGVNTVSPSSANSSSFDYVIHRSSGVVDSVVPGYSVDVSSNETLWTLRFNFSNSYETMNQPEFSLRLPLNAQFAAGDGVWVNNVSVNYTFSGDRLIVSNSELTRNNGSSASILNVSDVLDEIVVRYRTASLGTTISGIQQRAGTGSTIHPGGQVTFANGSGVADASVQLRFLYANGSLMDVVNTTTNSTGFWSVDYTLPAGVAPQTLWLKPLLYTNRSWVEVHSYVNSNLSSNTTVPVDGLSSSGLVGSWSFDNTLFDGSGNNNNGTWQGSTTPNWTTGISGGALQFDGVDDYVEVPDSDSLDITGDFTESFWAYKRQTPDGYTWFVIKSSTIFDHLTNNFNSIEWWVTFTDVGRKNIFYREVWDSNKWYHFSFVRKTGEYWKFYVNGELESTYTSYLTNPINTNNNSLKIGWAKSGSATTQFNGTIDDVRIYSRALSSDEVRGLYERGVGRYVLDKVTVVSGGDVLNPALSDGTHVLRLNRWLITNGTWVYYRNGTSLVDGVVDYNVTGEMPVLVNTTNLTFTSGSDVPVSLVLNWSRNRSEDWRGVQSTSFKADRVSLPANIEGNSSMLLVSGSPVEYQSDGQLLITQDVNISFNDGANVTVQTNASGGYSKTYNNPALALRENTWRVMVTDPYGIANTTLLTRVYNYSGTGTLSDSSVQAGKNITVTAVWNNTGNISWSTAETSTVRLVSQRNNTQVLTDSASLTGNTTHSAELSIPAGAALGYWNAYRNITLVSGTYAQSTESLLVENATVWTSGLPELSNRNYDYTLTIRVSKQDDTRYSSVDTLVLDSGSYVVDWLNDTHFKILFAQWETYGVGERFKDLNDDKDYVVHSIINGSSVRVDRIGFNYYASADVNYSFNNTDTGQVDQSGTATTNLTGYATLTLTPTTLGNHTLHLWGVYPGSNLEAETIETTTVQVINVTLSTDKSSYDQEETVYINGTTDQDTGGYVNITRQQDATLIQSHSVTASGGVYSDTWNIPITTLPGVYYVNASFTNSTTGIVGSKSTTITVNTRKEVVPVSVAATPNTGSVNVDMAISTGLLVKSNVDHMVTLTANVTNATSELWSNSTNIDISKWTNQSGIALGVFNTAQHSPGTYTINVVAVDNGTVIGEGNSTLTITNLINATITALYTKNVAGVDTSVFEKDEVMFVQQLVENTGNTQETITGTASTYSGGSSIDTVTDSKTLGAGESSLLDGYSGITLTAAKYQNASYDVKTNIQIDGSIYDWANKSIIILEDKTVSTSNIRVVHPSNGTANTNWLPGDTIEARADINNTGNNDTSGTIKAWYQHSNGSVTKYIGSSAGVSFNLPYNGSFTLSDKFTLGERQYTISQYQAPETGLSLVVQLIYTDENGVEVVDNTSTVWNILPVHSATADTTLASNTTDAGEYVKATTSVQNTGNTPETFHVLYKLTPYGGGETYWNTTKTATISPGDTQNVEAYAYADMSAPPANYTVQTSVYDSSETTLYASDSDNLTIVNTTRASIQGATADGTRAQVSVKNTGNIDQNFTVIVRLTSTENELLDEQQTTVAVAKGNLSTVTLYWDTLLSDQTVSFSAYVYNEAGALLDSLSMFKDLSATVSITDWTQLSQHTDVVEVGKYVEFVSDVYVHNYGTIVAENTWIEKDIGVYDYIKIERLELNGTSVVQTLLNTKDWGSTGLATYNTSTGKLRLKIDSIGPGETYRYRYTVYKQPIELIDQARRDYVLQGGVGAWKINVKIRNRNKLDTYRNIELRLTGVDYENVVEVKDSAGRDLPYRKGSTIISIDAVGAGSDYELYIIEKKPVPKTSLQKWLSSETGRRTLQIAAVAIVTGLLLYIIGRPSKKKRREWEPTEFIFKEK